LARNLARENIWPAGDPIDKGAGVKFEAHDAFSFRKWIIGSFHAVSFPSSRTSGRLSSWQVADYRLMPNSHHAAFESFF